MTLFTPPSPPTLIGYAELHRGVRVSVWLDMRSALERKVYVADDPVRYDDAGMPIGLRPAPRVITTAAGYGKGVKLEAMRDARKAVIWRSV